MNQPVRSVKRPARRKSYKARIYKGEKEYVVTTHERIVTIPLKNEIVEPIDTETQVGIVQEGVKAKRGRPHRTGKVLNGRPSNRRTGPKGNIAVVSDDAVERITADMEKRTRIAIAKIGRSTGF